VNIPGLFFECGGLVVAEQESGAATNRGAASLQGTPTVFEERYGTGSRERLIALLQQPCVTFATIAQRFGVTRERVRQWHRDLLPDAPTGHARQRLCARHQQRRRLLQDPLFRTFVRHVQSHFGPGAVQPVQSRQGYRTRVVHLDNHLVALRDAAPSAEGAPEPHRFRYRGTAEYVYVCLGPDAFLFLPALDLTNLDTFRNSFAALARVERQQSA
jgi:hypothetical protein